jgi:hypothetical protein
MPLMHRFSGPGFAPSEPQPQKLRAAPTLSPEGICPRLFASEPNRHAHCRLCSGRVPIFDPSRRCCVDRYETQFGSVEQHRGRIASALRAATLGDLGPARRLVESYRRVFGPMAAVELRRSLWRSIGDPRLGPLDHGFESAATAAG